VLKKQRRFSGHGENNYAFIVFTKRKQVIVIARTMEKKRLKLTNYSLCHVVIIKLKLIQRTAQVIKLLCGRRRKLKQADICDSRRRLSALCSKLQKERPYTLWDVEHTSKKKK